MEWRMELSFSLRKGLGPPGMMGGDRRVEGEMISLWINFLVHIRGWNVENNDVPFLHKVKGKDQKRIFTSKGWIDPIEV